MVTRVASLFDTVYGRLPSPEELAHIYAHGNVNDDTPSSTLVHRLIGMHERNMYPTPFNVRFLAQDIRYCPVEGVTLAIDTADHSVGRIVEQGTYAPDIVTFLRRSLKPGMTFVDIGANIGYFTMIGASLVGPTGKVVAFEPYSENCRLILLSKEQNKFDNIELHAVALGRHAGSACFSPALGSNAGFLAPTDSPLLHPNCMVVPVARLDDLAPDHVDVVKIDVEGAEAMIFEGAPRLIERTRPVILAEFAASMTRQTSEVEPADYLRRMQTLGYSIARVDAETAEEIPVRDVDAFLARDMLPLQDLVFRPG